MEDRAALATRVEPYCDQVTFVPLYQAGCDGYDAVLDMTQAPGWTRYADASGDNHTDVSPDRQLSVEFGPEIDSPAIAPLWRIAYRNPDPYRRSENSWRADFDGHVPAEAIATFLSALTSASPRESASDHDRELTLNAVITELETTIGRTTNNGPKVTRVWYCGDYTIRARVAHDSYEQQSYAFAEVLTPALTWTTVCTTPTGEFYVEPFARIPKPKPTEVELLELADALMRRACQVLRIPIPAADTPLIAYVYISAEEAGEFYKRVLDGCVAVLTDDDGREIHVELSVQDNK